MSANPPPPEPGEIITFYSYKGGTGRSMALANVACLLAQSKEGYDGVLMVDWDLEAPGLHRYFSDRFERQFPTTSKSSSSLKTHPGLIDLFERLREEIAKLPSVADEPTPEMQEQLHRAIDINSFILETDVPNLYIIKAGCFDEDYARRVNTFPWEPLYKQAPWLISFFADWLTSRFRYVLIDSRTGITDTSGICTMLLPDKLVVVFTPNQQSLDGVLEMTERATNYRRRSSDVRPLSVFPLASRIESSEPELRARWRKTPGMGYQPRFEALFRKVWELEECNLESYLNEVQIQHASAYAYGERVAVLAEQSDDRTSLRRAFVSFAERLATLDEPWESIVMPAAANPATALADTAESLFAQFSPGRQDIARFVFLQLVKLPVDATRPAAREVSVEVFSSEQREVIDVLLSAKLLIAREDPDSGTYVCLSNDSLISEWRRLVEWIAANAAFLNWRDAIDSYLTAWEKHNKSKELLLRGKPLDEAIAKLASKRDDLNRAEYLYIRTSTLTSSRAKLLTWVAAAAALIIVILAIFGINRLRTSSSLAQAEAILGQSGLDAAIRAERVAPNSPTIDTALRTLLSETPQPVLLLSNSQTPDSMAFSPDETFIAASYGSKGIFYRDLSNGNAQIQTVETPSGYRANTVMALKPGGTFTVALGTAVGQIYISSTSPLQNAAPANAANGMSAPIRPNASSLVLRGRVTSKTVVNSDSFSLQAGTDGINALAFSPDGNSLASASGDGTIRLWSTSSRKVFASMEPGGAIRQVLYSPNGEYVVSGDQSALRVWLARDGQPVAAFRSTSNITGFCFFPGSDRLAVGQGNKQIAILSLPHLTSVSSLSTTTPVQDLACPSPKAIWAVFPDGTCQKLGLDGTTKKWIPYAQGSASLVISPKAKYFATTVANGTGILISRPDPENAAHYSSLNGVALADTACQKFKLIAPLVTNYSKACPKSSE